LGATKARARAFKAAETDKTGAGTGREALAGIAPKGLGQEGASTSEASVGMDAKGPPRGVKPSAVAKAGLSTKSSVGARPVYGTGPGGKIQQQGGSRWQQMSGASTSTAEGTADIASTRGGRFAKEDVVGTNRAIQDEWKRGRKTKDVLAACARINSFLDNPLFASDEDRAAVTVQRVFRGWMLRVSRHRGTVLFPVEAQTLADSRVLMHNEYGARIYSMSPPQRRRLVCQHFAAKTLQRVWRRHRPAGGAQLKPEESCISVAPEDSLLMVPGEVNFIDFACSEQQAVSAVQLLQRAVRCRRARKQCKRMRLRLSKAVNFLRFLSSELGDATTLDAVRVRGAAALRMQACWRGVSCRSKLKGSIKTRAWAATTLQKSVRGWSSRRKLDKLLERLLLKRALRWWNKIMWTIYSPGKAAQDAATAAGRFFMENGVVPLGREGCEEVSAVRCADIGERTESADKGAHATQEATEDRMTPRQEISPTPPTAIRPSKIGAYKSAGGMEDEDEDEDGGTKRSLWVEREEEGDTVMIDAQETPRQQDIPRQEEHEIPKQTAQETPRQSWQVVEEVAEESSRLTSMDLSSKARVGESTSETVGKEGGGDGTAPLPENKTQWPETYSNSMCFEPGALKQGNICGCCVNLCMYMY
jgi:hypothetical protein